MSRTNFPSLKIPAAIWAQAVLWKHRHQYHATKRAVTSQWRSIISVAVPEQLNACAVVRWRQDRILVVLEKGFVPQFVADLDSKCQKLRHASQTSIRDIVKWLEDLIDIHAEHRLLMTMPYWSKDWMRLPSTI